jgi:hypothetical protein
LAGIKRPLSNLITAVPDEIHELSREYLHDILFSLSSYTLRTAL